MRETKLSANKICGRCVGALGLIASLVSACTRPPAEPRSSVASRTTPVTARPEIELDVEADNAAAFQLVATRRGQLSLGHFDRDRAFVSAGTELYTVSAQGALERTGVSLPPGTSARELTGKWPDSLWIGARSGIQRARHGAWEAVPQTYPLARPVWFDGAFMSLEQQTGYLTPAIEKDPVALQQLERSVVRRFVVVDGSRAAEARVPAIEPMHWVGDYAATPDGAHLFAIVGRVNAGSKLVRWSAGTRAWRDVLPPLRRGGQAASVDRFVGSTRTRLYATATTPRISDVDPPGVTTTGYATSETNCVPFTMTDSTREVLVAFDGDVASVIEVPDGRIAAVEETATGELYIIVSPRMSITRSGVLYRRQTRESSWQAVPLPRARLAPSIAGDGGPTSIDLTATDVIVREGQLWLTAVSEPLVSSGSAVSDWPLAQYELLLRMGPR